MKSSIAFHLMSLILIERSLAKCPDKYADLGTGCYQITEQEGITWHQSYVICASKLGGYMAEIESQQEQDNLMHYIKTTVDPPAKYGFWLGASNQSNKQGEFRWMTSGHWMTFSQWFTSQPDNLNGNEHCLMTFNYTDYKWNDLGCNDLTYRMKAICEINRNQ